MLLSRDRTDKVASLVITRNGEYKVDTARLADKMLTEALNEELSWTTKSVPKKCATFSAGHPETEIELHQALWEQLQEEASGFGVLSGNELLDSESERQDC